ncbi:hypothetical protein [Chitinophaga sp. MM2321]|uniref:hypothetical protein n=1 Tax=Chitinophaga sp. MM2321 TaxID=3137178 RepID=UPI0032D59557
MLYLSFDSYNTPEELPIESLKEEAEIYFKSKLSIQEIFTCFRTINTLAADKKIDKRHKNYLLSTSLLHKINGDDLYRNEEFANFFTADIPAESGIVLLDDDTGGTQYVYMLWDENMTKALKSREGRFLSAAVFLGNIFMGFEEAILLPDGDVLLIEPGYYSTGMNRGDSIIFVMIFLSYLRKRTSLSLVDAELNKTTECIYFLE